MNCTDCPPAGYPTDKTRCDSCPRRQDESEYEDEGYLNSPTCISCGWHPEEEGHDEECPLSAV